MPRPVSWRESSQGTCRDWQQLPFRHIPPQSPDNIRPQIRCEDVPRLRVDDDLVRVRRFLTGMECKVGGGGKGREVLKRIEVGCG